MTSPAPEPGGYAWPPLPVTDPEVAALLLAERLARAYEDLESERRAVAAAAAAGLVFRHPEWLDDFAAALAVFRERAAQEVVSWLLNHLAPRYQEGMVAASGGSSSWTQIHVTALTSLAVDTYEDFLGRSQEAGRTSEAFARAVRAAAGDELPKIAAGGRTARQAADRLEARLLTGYGVDTVTYRDGSRVPVRQWARMAARTKSRVAYNAGSLNDWQQQDVGYVEVFDGPSCGWSYHDDPDQAHGSVRSLAEAAAAPLGHPNCRRSFGPRPDVTTQAEADAAVGSTTVEQDQDQAVTDYLAGQRVTPLRPAQLRRVRLLAQRRARLVGATGSDAAAILRATLAERGIT